MNHFLHKHRHWFLALVVIAVVGLIAFQFLGDPGPEGEPEQAVEPASATDAP